MDAPTQFAEPELRGRHVLILNWRDIGHPEGGGSEYYVDQVAQGLVEAGAQVTMACPRYEHAARREIRHGIQYLRVGGHLSIYLLAPLLLLLRRVPRPDLVIEVQNGMPFLASLYARCPVLILIHHVHREQWRIVRGPVGARLGWILESRVAPRVGRRASYVTVSDATRRDLAELGIDRQRVALVHNGTPPVDARHIEERSITPRLLALGRLVPHKRVEIAIDTLADLRREFPSLELDVAGEGWWYPELQDYARRRGVMDSVRFLGHVTERRKSELLSRDTVLLVPSIKEGWGIVVMEAAARGTPAVAFRSAGGATESIVQAHTGFLADSPAHFTAVTRTLLTRTDLREELGDNARAHAARYTWRASKDAFTALASRVMHRSPAGER